MTSPRSALTTPSSCGDESLKRLACSTYSIGPTGQLRTVEVFVDDSVSVDPSGAVAVTVRPISRP